MDRVGVRIEEQQEVVVIDVLAAVVPAPNSVAVEEDADGPAVAAVPVLAGHFFTARPEPGDIRQWCAGLARDGRSREEPAATECGVVRAEF